MEILWDSVLFRRRCWGFFLIGTRDVWEETMYMSWNTAIWSYMLMHIVFFEQCRRYRNWQKIIGIICICLVLTDWRFCKTVLPALCKGRYIYCAEWPRLSCHLCAIILGCCGQYILWNVPGSIRFVYLGVSFNFSWQCDMFARKLRWCSFFTSYFISVNIDHRMYNGASCAAYSLF